MASKPVQNSKKCLESVQNPYKNLRFDENPYNSCNAYVTFAQRYVTFRTHISMVELNEDGGSGNNGRRNGRSHLSKTVESESSPRRFAPLEDGNGEPWEALTAIHAIRVRRTDRGTA